jgi:hypothetical protein
MGYDAERKSIESYFQTQWADTTDVVYGYMAVPEFQSGTTFVNIHVAPGPEAAVSIGSQLLHRFGGIIGINIFSPPREGQKTALADQICTLFRDQKIDDVQCTWARMAPPLYDHGWMITPIEIAYQRDELV